MAVAALTMYSEPGAVRAAYEDLVQEVARRFGVALQPYVEAELASLWLHPELLLAQTCGFPWASSLQGKVKLVASPQYTLPGCDGATHCSFILVPESSPARSLADLRQKRAAINSQDSNSGMNLFRHAIAPLSQQGGFFSSVVESGGHIRSMEMLQQGLADAAAVDAVTYGYLQRDAPERIAGVRILAKTVKSPTLPLITAATRSDEEVNLLRQILSNVVVDRPDIARTLAIKGFKAAAESKYLAVLEWQDEATRLGYSRLE
jgi:ABC-type phosphate/phosphonate transport system substrate-binding protein